MFYLRILLALAILPGVGFMYYVYRQDRIESEPAKLVIKILIFGALSAIPIVIVELLMEYPIGAIAASGSLLYLILNNFIGVALIEEGGKFIVTKLCTWKNPEFNFKFDGVVYAVAASLGFAILENVLYCLDGGIGTALMRAVLSVPGHGMYGIFMGYYYALAKDCDHDGNPAGAKVNLIMALVVPTLLHGFYDFALSCGSTIMLIIVLIFVVLLYIFAFRKIKALSRTDEAL